MLVKNAWYVAAWADELGAAPLGRRICDEAVVLFRDAAGRASALADYCCHRSARSSRPVSSAAITAWCTAATVRV
jgi:vanillate O-demethylase monooxygenase subunit